MNLECENSLNISSDINNVSEIRNSKHEKGIKNMKKKFKFKKIKYIVGNRPFFDLIWIYIDIYNLIELYI